MNGILTRAAQALQPPSFGTIAGRIIQEQERGALSYFVENICCPMFGGHPTALSIPRMLTSEEGFGVRTNQFEFNISWAEGMAVAVDACADLAGALWTPLQTNALTDGWSYSSDPEWTNYPTRFYRVRWP